MKEKKYFLWVIIIFSFLILNCGVMERIVEKPAIVRDYDSAVKKNTIESYQKFIDKYCSKKSSPYFISAKDSLLFRLREIQNIRIDHVAVFRDLPENEKMKNPADYEKAKKDDETIKNMICQMFEDRLIENYNVVSGNEDAVLNIAYSERLIPYFSSYRGETFSSDKFRIDIYLHLVSPYSGQSYVFWRPSENVHCQTPNYRIEKQCEDVTGLKYLEVGEVDSLLEAALPNPIILGDQYEQFARYKLTETSFENIRSEHTTTLLVIKKKKVPKDIMAKLGSIKNKIFISKSNFVNAIEQAIGKENAVLYKDIIIKHAEVSW